MNILNNTIAPPIPYFQPIDLLIPYIDTLQAIVDSENPYRHLKDMTIFIYYYLL